MQLVNEVGWKEQKREMNGVLDLQLLQSGKCGCPGNNVTFSRLVFVAIFLESFLAL